MIQFIIAAVIIYLIYNYYAGTQEPISTNMENRVKLVSAMFPHVPKVLIETDLRNGSTVEQVCEKIMSGRLTENSIPLSVPSAPSTAVTDRKSLDKSSKPQSNSINEHLDRPIIQEEPPKVWESESDKRQELLRQRKAFMIQQARLKFLNKD